jgi:hypothetical protein
MEAIGQPIRVNERVRLVMAIGPEETIVFVVP